MPAQKTRTDPQPDNAQFNSLFGEILDWMLAPLLFLWPISIAVIFGIAKGIADVPYDQALSEDLLAIARQVQVASDGSVTSLPAQARNLLRHDQVDTIYYQVRGPGGRPLAGDAEIPDVPQQLESPIYAIRYRDELISGEEVRVAYRYLGPRDGRHAPAALVQVAETRGKRTNLANRIIAGVLLPQFAIIPLAVVLVYLGLGRGIAPLSRLQRLIEHRRPSDLSLIDTQGMPEEVVPILNAFNAMMGRLEQNLKAQQRFIADAAHQMRTPLAGLKMQTELALSETDATQIRTSLEGISASADRTAHLINQLLALARAEASFDKAPAAQVVDLESVLKESAPDFFPQARRKRIDFGIDVTGRPLLVEGNPLQLREMIKNLIDNAIKYTAEGGKVTARTVGTALASLEVEDDGIGIPPEERERVFERFYRSLGSGAEGSGLGLAIVREIAELHRAHVRLETGADGKGTLVIVSFPRRRAKTAEPPPPNDAFPLA
ncbi:MAG: sensor histidine kinase N-terminal domain-containing protein [Rhodocyclaceae bacterium]